MDSEEYRSLMVKSFMSDKAITKEEKRKAYQKLNKTLNTKRVKND